jgi:NAD(P)-dependent dehydrogenase (short-subunit alcohol dehydrogenase family)
MSFQPFDLSGRVALITGGNGGIGLGMARGLLEAGAEVAIWGTNPDKNQRALESLAAIGPKVTTGLCDVADEAAVAAGFTRVLDDHGRVDGCFAKGPDHRRQSDWRVSHLPSRCQTHATTGGSG